MQIWNNKLKLNLMSDIEIRQILVTQAHGKDIVLCFKYNTPLLFEFQTILDIEEWLDFYKNKDSKSYVAWIYLNKEFFEYAKIEELFIKQREIAKQESYYDDPTLGILLLALWSSFFTGKTEERIAHRQTLKNTISEIKKIPSYLFSDEKEHLGIIMGAEAEEEKKLIRLFTPVILASIIPAYIFLKGLETTSTVFEWWQKLKHR